MTEIDVSSRSSTGGEVVARNLGILMGSQVLTWGLSIITTIAVPRYLGAELTGQLHLANSVWAIGVVVMAFGTNLVVVKAVARDSNLAGPLIATGVAARLLLFLPVALGVFLYAMVSGYSRQMLVLMGMVGVGAAIRGVTAGISSILRGLEKMGLLSVANIVGQSVFAGGALLLLLNGYSLYAIALLAGFGSLVSLVLQAVAIRYVRNESGDRSPFDVTFRSIRALLGESVPYFWIKLFGVLYLQVDVIIISLVVRDDEVLGWYSVFDRLHGTLLFIPTVFVSAVYPALARLYGKANDSERGFNSAILRRSFEMLLLASVPIGFGLAVISRQLVALLFGPDYEGAAPVVAVGGLTISLTYITSILGMFLISMDLQREWTRFIGFGAVMTVPLDLVLVPYFQSNFQNGAIGGAVAFGVTEAIILGGAVYLLPRGALGPAPLLYAMRVVLAGLVMAAVIWPLRGHFLPIPVAAGAVVYLFSAWALRVLTLDEWKLVRTVLPGRAR